MRPFITAAPHAEPPALTITETRPTVTTPRPQPDPRCARRPDLHAPRRVSHTARTPRHAAAADDRTDVADTDCRRFAEVTLRLILEVLDHRRQLPALRPLLASTPCDLVTVLTRAGAPGRRLGAARLRRVHVHPCGPDRAEVFGSYVRGERTFAIAGRVERAPAARRRSSDAGGGWMFTTLQVG